MFSSLPETDLSCLSGILNGLLDRPVTSEMGSRVLGYWCRALPESSGTALNRFSSSGMPCNLLSLEAGRKTR